MLMSPSFSVSVSAPVILIRAVSVVIGDDDNISSLRPRYTCSSLSCCDSCRPSLCNFSLVHDAVRVFRRPLKLADR
jgi:hypothetical protein